jgi:hypothetical protein
LTSDSTGVAERGPWLPPWLTFLSGLPEAARKRRVIVAYNYQVFADDSGGKGHDRHFVIAGLASTAQKWALFSDEWRACLDQPPYMAGKPFKMSQAAGCNGAFYRFTEDQRDARLLELVRIINRYVEVITHSIIDLDAHEKTWAKWNVKPNSEVYFHPFHNTINAMAFSLWDAGLRERFEAIFDEQVIFGPRAKHWYPFVRTLMEHREPEVHRIMPVDPIFRTDDEFMPIQAADLFAWCFRHNTSNPNNQRFEWILPEIKSVSLSEYAQYYDLERMTAVGEETKSLLKNGIPPELLEEYRKLLR